MSHTLLDTQERYDEIFVNGPYSRGISYAFCTRKFTVPL